MRKLRMKTHVRRVQVTMMEVMGQHRRSGLDVRREATGSGTVNWCVGHLDTKLRWTCPACREEDD